MVPVGELIDEPVEAPVILPPPQLATEVAVAAPVASPAEPPKPKKRIGPPGSFVPDIAWMNLAGCGHGERHRLPWALGYQPHDATTTETAGKENGRAPCKKSMNQEREISSVAD